MEDIESNRDKNLQNVRTDEVTQNLCNLNNSSTDVESSSKGKNITCCVKICSTTSNSGGNNNCGNAATSKAKNEKNRGNSNNNNKFNFRAPQQFSQKKKIWNKRYQKCHGGIGNNNNSCINKADVENLPNIKNQLNHHRQGGSQGQKNNKQQQIYINHKKKILSAAGGIAAFSIHSKFFLPDKCPRKEIIVPPTKFLLGGNISDPLNLNSLQDEAQSGNTTPSTTPRQSPVTTPPKIEVIIPPNIHDPLHLLDPVDSIEYEKQLVSPMKKKSKHRHRKKKPRRKRLTSTNSGIVLAITSPEINFTNALSCILRSEKENDLKVPSTISTDIITEQKKLIDSNEAVIDSKVKNVESTVQTSASSNNSVATAIENITEEKSELLNLEKTGLKGICGKRRSENRDRVAKELKLDLDMTADQQKQQMMNNSRKRKTSEAGSCKNKFRRMDSLDKIVSPVVPQPGAWKRPPRTVPTGGRKGSRNRSTSASETELISPTEELKSVETQIKDIEKTEVTAPSTSDKIEETETNKTISLDGKIDNTNDQIQLPAETLERLPKFRPEGVKYQYGNYDRYSGYRTVNEFIDIRLQVFQRNPELFIKKDILDIGCNVGHMTIAVGKKLCPKSILGIDIDPKLIGRARRNISLYVRIPNEEDENVASTSKQPDEINKSEEVKVENNKNCTTTDIELQNKDAKNISKTKLKRKRYFANKKKIKLMNKNNFFNRNQNNRDEMCMFPISFPICYGGIPSLEPYSNNSAANTPGSGLASASCSRSATPHRGGNNIFSRPKNDFPKNVFFRHCNYVIKDETLINNETQQYDLILCLSVTKWIHLNFGDVGLKMAFKRMFNQLRPGGKLILEAQNWASYKKKKNLTETIYKNYRSIEFFPNKFHEYLLSNEVGFSHSYTLGVPRHLSKGFCRPIQLYAKGDFTPNHARWSDAYYPQTPYEAYRGIYASIPRPPYPLWGSWDTPRGNSSSCRQTPYYNPLESDSYLPSYDTEVLNRHYVFASPLYQTVWSPPASLRNSSSHTPVFGSVREIDINEGGSNNRPRHVYLPNEESSSPQTNGAFNSIREESEQDSNSPARRHVYANYGDSSSSPRDVIVEDNNGLVTAPIVERSQEIGDSNDSET